MSPLFFVWCNILTQHPSHPAQAGILCAEIKAKDLDTDDTITFALMGSGNFFELQNTTSTSTRVVTTRKLDRTITSSFDMVITITDKGGRKSVVPSLCAPDVFLIFLPHFRLYEVVSLHTRVLPYTYRTILKCCSN